MAVPLISATFSSCVSGLFARANWLACCAWLFWLIVWPGQAHAAPSDTNNLASITFGLFIGVLLTASVYMFFIWVVMRDRGQVFLICLLLTLCVYIVSANDTLMHALGIDGASLRNLLSTYSLILSMIFGAAFTYYFLEVDAHSPLLGIPLFLCSLLLTILLVVSLSNQMAVSYILPSLSILVIASILVAGVASLYYNVSGSFTHIIAFAFFLVGALADSCYEIGLVNTVGSTQNLANAAFSLSAVMFAIVIAGQFAARQDEKEKALAISNERFVLTTRGANEGLFDWNLASGEVFFSDQFRKVLGFRLENAPQGLKQWARMVVNPDRRIMREALRRFRRSAGVSTINIEYRIGLPNGERKWLHTKIVAVRLAASKRIVRLVGSTHDVTTRKQSEVALRASEARFRSITEAHPVPVMIVALNYGRILYASPGAEQLLSLTQEQLLDANFEIFLSDRQARQDLWDAMRAGQEVNLKEVRLEHVADNFLDAALSARRISYQGEEAMVIGLYDLTERKRAEAQISRQQEALQQSEKMAALGGLLAGVAHELNNPLSVIIGQATLLMESATEPKIVSRGEKIYKAADRCSRIVKSFLALARRKPPERKPVSLNDIIHAALELLGYQIRTNNVDVLQDLDPNLPEVNGDGDQLTQVITNLVMNATQAMEGWQGTRKLSITNYREDNNVVLVVADTGPGVPTEIRTRVFEPFFTTKSDRGGTGVGLSLCLNIIASHGGQLMLEDTPGGGATFRIQLPMAAAQASESSEDGAVKDLHLGRLNILLVDDEVELAQTLADLLEPEGHNVALAANGAIALEKLRKNPVDVIVSDLRMPVLDGPGLYEELKKEMPQYLDRIIYVTGDTLSTHVQAFLSAYPVPVVEKPYRLADVKKAMDDLIKKHPPKG